MTAHCQVGVSLYGIAALQEASEQALRQLAENDLHCCHTLISVLELQAAALRRYQGAYINRAHRSKVATASFRVFGGLIVPMCEQMVRAVCGTSVRGNAGDSVPSSLGVPEDGGGAALLVCLIAQAQHPEIAADSRQEAKTYPQELQQELQPHQEEQPREAPVHDAAPESQQWCEVLVQATSSWADLITAVDMLPSSWRLPSSSAEAIVRSCEVHSALLSEVANMLTSPRVPAMSRSSMGVLMDEAQTSHASTIESAEALLAAQLRQSLGNAKGSLLP